jgi:parallel beta-helix repeat protein
MPVRAELTRGRLLAALVLITILPALLALTAVLYTTPASTPGPPAYNPLPLARNEVLLALQSRELQRSRRLAATAPTLAAPMLYPPTFPQVLPTIVLPPRAEPYTLAEVQQTIPEAFEQTDGTIQVNASIEVPTGVQFVIDGSTPNVRLVSSTDRFATVIARGGTVDIAGTEQAPVAVTSWDPATGGADINPNDGRAFLLTLGGRMDISYADIGFLGFGTGTSSGAAWRSEEHSDLEAGARAFGDVTGATFHNNWFGSYTYEAEGMQWIGNTFANNEAYGFDPHDLSNNFLVEGNTAYGNGRHGFIFSRGCDNNVLRNNTAYDNRGHGFMIDDGRSEDTATASARRLPSNDSVLEGNHAYNNDGSGIEIEGGTGTIIRDNVLTGNHVGVRIKNEASAVVHNNKIADSALAGIDVFSGNGRVSIKDNVITAGWASIALGAEDAATLSGNTLSGASTDTAVAGKAIRDEDLATQIGRIFRWNPLLVVWTAILGIPLILVGRSLVHTVRRRLQLRFRTPAPRM